MFKFNFINIKVNGEFTHSSCFRNNKESNNGINYFSKQRKKNIRHRRNGMWASKSIKNAVYVKIKND
jgi:hypothetical protein